MDGRIGVLFIISTLRTCSPVTMLLNIVRNLDESVIDANVLTLSPESATTDIDHFRSLGINVRSLGLSHSVGCLVGRRALSSFLAENEFDIINSHGFRADMFAAGLAKTIPVIATVHNELNSDYCITYGRLQGWCMAKLHHRALARLTKVVGCSEYVAGSLRGSGIDATFIRNGVDTDLYRPVAQDEKQALRKRLELPGNGWIVVSAGNLSPLKDPLTVIEGFLRSKLRALGTLVLLGDGPLEQECVRRAESTDASIRVPGRVNNVSEYLMAADCFVSASRTEGLPVAVVEGLACGLPACLSAIPPHEEIRNVKPPACELFEPGNSAELASVLDKTAAELGPATSQIAISAVTEHLNARRMSQEYQSLFREYGNSH